MILSQKQIIEDMEFRVGYKGTKTKQLKLSVEDFEEFIDILKQSFKMNRKYDEMNGYDTATRQLGYFNVR